MSIRKYAGRPGKTNKYKNTDPLQSLAPIRILVGTAAAAVAGLAYLDARLSLWSDVNYLLCRRVVSVEVGKAGRLYKRSHLQTTKE